MIKKSFCCISMVVLLMVGCVKPSSTPDERCEKEFTHEVVLKTTPVKDQGRSAFCWVFAMLATIETEHLMMGDSVNLSTDYYARKLISDNVRRYYFTQNEADLSMRGMPSMLLNMLRQHGAEPYDTYSNRAPINYNVLLRKLQQMARASVSVDKLNSSMERLLDETIGFLPNYVFMAGAEYTAKEFGHSVCQPDEYLCLTSFSHHPFGQKFVLESPDNLMRDSLTNVPIDQLMQRVVRALRNGHPVCWQGDISEPGFDYVNGRAALVDENIKVDQGLRQRAFERRQTTDDHAMSLCGLARDRQGKLYFIAKNSWGRDNRYGGFMYLSYQYVKLKTIAFYMSRAAWQGRRTG